MSNEELPIVSDLREAILAAQAKGMSLNEIGRGAGVSAAQLSRFLTGNRTLNLPAVAKLSAYFALRLVRRDQPKSRRHQMPIRGNMSTAAWFVDGEYLYKVWQGLHRTDKLDFLKLRKLL